MKRTTLKWLGLLLCLGVLLGSFSACTADADTQPTVGDKIPETVVMVTIQADGKEYVIEQAQGKSIEELLEQAEVTLEEGDMLCVDTDRQLTDLVICVVRQKKVTIEIKNADNQIEKEYVAVLMDGTVEDALKLLGIELNENQELNYDLSKTLEDGMEISIFVQESEPEPTEPEDDDNSGSGNSGSSGNSGNTGSSGNSGNSGSSGNSGNSGSSGGNSDGNSDPKPEPKPEPEPEPETQPQKTVVNVDYYYDCDGSGHGVKVITYSDGTQEEVPF